MSEFYIERAGIVNGVTAKRKDKEVSYLEVALRFETELDDIYYGTDVKIDNMTVALPVSSGVQAGDVVVITVQTRSPQGVRFQRALEINDDEEATDEAVVV